MHDYDFQLLSGGTAPYDIFTCRKEDFSEEISIAHIDLTGATFSAAISAMPGTPALLTLDVSAVSTATKTYQQWIDECVITEADIPCSYTASDNMVVSTVTVSKSQASIGALPAAQTLGGSAHLHWALLQTAPDIDMIAAGQFTLTETA